MWILFPILISSLLLSYCYSEPQTNVVFPGTKEIFILYPHDGDLIKESELYFKWQPDEDDVEVVLVISKSRIRQENFRISNIEDIVAGWRLKCSTEHQNGYASIEQLRILKNNNFCNDTAPSLSSSNTYYWAVWSYDEYLQLYRSSRIYTFTLSP